MSQAAKSEPRAAAPGALVGAQLGDFVVQRLIGSGGMGEVYLAEQVSLRRPVALKVLRPELAQDQSYLTRFRSEATAISPIQHPNIVSVYAIGCEDGVHYIAFEYVRGSNLRQYIDRHGPLEEARCVLVASRVAAALVRAAEAGIVHRDIKPENVLLTKRGEVKVADFGLARQMGGDDVRLTQTGVTMGTPLYMSPEQIHGRAVDVRSDIYSLGVMCYHMLAGEPPFRGETAMAVAIQHVHGRPEPLEDLRPDVRREFLQIVRRMMAKEPADRYASAEELLRDLERLNVGQERILDFLPRVDRGSVRRWLRRALRRTSDVASKLLSPPLRLWTVAAGVILSLCLGMGAATAARRWMERDRAPGRPFPPDVSSVKPLESGYMQLEYARNVLDEKGREPGLWAVLFRFKGDDRSTIQAARDLAALYLDQRRYDDLEALAKYLIEREDPDQQACGLLLRGLAQARQSNAAASDASFNAMLDPLKQASLDWGQFDWLLRQLFLALRQNDDHLGRSPEQSLARKERFWQVLRNGARP